MLTEHPVIFYDGLCGLCDRTVQFILKRDPEHKFRFATLQSDYAARALGDKISYDSFVFYHNQRARYRSSGALYMFKSLGGFWSLLFVFMIVPPFIRDGIYNWVARNRFSWFGRLDSCRIPSEEEKELFIS